MNRELAFVLIADSIDYTYGLGAIPILGDIADVLFMVYLASIGGIWYFVGSAELIPMVDVFPTMTTVYIAKYYIMKKGNELV